MNPGVINMTNIPPRPEYPRPQFRRENSWINLNGGEWDFSFDRDTFDKKIMVPYAYQTNLSGIDIQDFMMLSGTESACSAHTDEG